MTPSNHKGVTSLHVTVTHNYNTYTVILIFVDFAKLAALKLACKLDPEAPGCIHPCSLLDVGCTEEEKVKQHVHGVCANTDECRKGLECKFQVVDSDLQY